MKGGDRPSRQGCGVTVKPVCPPPAISECAGAAEVPDFREGKSCALRELHKDSAPTYKVGECRNLLYDVSGDKEKDVDIQVKCPYTAGVLTVGYGLSARSYRELKSTFENNGYRDAFDCTRRNGSFSVAIDGLALYDLLSCKKDE